MALHPGAEWFDQQVRAAAQIACSDLSFEPQDDGSYQAVIRLDGLRRVCACCPAKDAPALLARAKALAGLPGYIVDQPQDGSMDASPFALPGHLRLAVLPTVRGQRLALRLPALGALPAPEALGLPSALLEQLTAALQQPDGLLLLAGPTGSGKTTTLHSLVAQLVEQRQDRCVIALEDPVERRLPGVSHVAIQEERGLSFLDALRAALRQDADIIIVGEVRDGQTANACVRAALAGHLVLASIHAPRAREVVPRLLEMGVDPDLLLPCLHGVLAQRLLRRCNGSGGRCLVADWIKVDSAARQAWRQGRGKSIPLEYDMDRCAAELIRQGISSRQEMQRVLGNCDN